MNGSTYKIKTKINLYQEEMNHIKQICKDPVKVEQKLQGKEFLLGKYFNLKSDCKRCKKDKKFSCTDLFKYLASKRQKLLQIQHKLNQEQLQLKQPKQPQSKIPGNELDLNKHPLLNLSHMKMIDEKQENTQKSTINQIPLSYEYFIPLHKLWKAYIQDLVVSEQRFLLLSKNQQSACLKLLRSDFVGAEIQVVYSKVASYIGKTGIIIKQTLKSFVLAKKPTLSANETKLSAKSQQKTNQNPKSNKKTVVNLLKNQIIFRVQCGDKNYLINGNTLVYRPSDRSKHKFKSRMAEKLNLDFLGNFIDENE